MLKAYGATRIFAAHASFHIFFRGHFEEAVQLLIQFLVDPFLLKQRPEPIG